uniref:Uncharacterized protein n=1 Tax=Candidatus Kentrum sp. DK TaxID=2126562 RepID=A0A450S784_9GAMM|nr:MAG: hypothetical protein BECKDK2373C_GA0170839_101925 [Candidatus Kentron sp. DK]
MKEAAKLHREAMDYADAAEEERIRGNKDKSLSLARLALDKETQAANLVADSDALEPTRSVLHRSAASLALECGEYRLAEKLIGRALSGEPPDEITEELRELYSHVCDVGLQNAESRMSAWDFLFFSSILPFVWLLFLSTIAWFIFPPVSPMEKIMMISFVFISLSSSILLERFLTSSRIFHKPMGFFRGAWFAVYKRDLLINR